MIYGFEYSIVLQILTLAAVTLKLFIKSCYLYVFVFI